MAAAIDHEARRDAALAHQKIDSHEANCGERWAEARDEMKSLHSRISETKVAMDSGHKRLTGWLIAGQGSVILLLISFLLSKHLG